MKEASNLENKNEEGICFSSSYLSWITRTELSNGIFRLDSVLIHRSNKQEETTFVLCSGVPAGRMYADTGPLLKTPKYFYQFIGGSKTHKIIRTPAKESNQKLCEDSHSENKSIFLELDFHLNKKKAKAIKADALIELSSLNTPVNLCIYIKRNHESIYIESPLKHWNFLSRERKWQVESASILWPSNLDNFCKNANSSFLIPVCLHANKSNMITISGERIKCHEIAADLSFLELQ